jgi:hypothetical protein
MEIDHLINNAINLLKTKETQSDSKAGNILLCEELRYVQQKIAERTYPRTYDALPSMQYAEEKIKDPIALDAVREVNKWYISIYCRKGL